MKRIAAYRKQIDTLDRALIALFIRRVRVANRIWDEKRKAGLPMNDPRRENQILIQAGKQAKPPLKSEDVRKFKSLLIQISKKTMKRRGSRRRK